MPSSKLSRSPAKTLSAIGLRRASSITRSAVPLAVPEVGCVTLFSLVGLLRSLSLATFAYASLYGGRSRFLPPRHRYRRAPEQQKQETNIAVHGKKRSIQPPQVIRVYQRMLVSQQ